MMLLGIKLFLAHILGDFVFQPTNWIKDKNINKQKSVFLYLHLLVHFLTLILFLGFNFSYWLGIIIIVVSHYLIDLLKLTIQDKINKPLWIFICDQLAHSLILLWVLKIYFPFKISIAWLNSPDVLIFLMTILFVFAVIN